MTYQPLSSTKAGRGANNPRSEVEVINGRIFMTLYGVWGPVAPFSAWGLWLSLQDSPLKASRERAKAIRGALQEIGYPQ